MQFVFEEERAAEAAAHLLQMGGGEMDRLKLIKLLYLADRQVWIETGLTITGDEMVSMPHGPVLSRILNLIRAENPVASEAMERFVLPGGGHKVRLRQAPPAIGRLSRYHVRILGEIYGRFGHWSISKLYDYVHQQLPEYHDPAHSSSPIDPTEILKDAGQDADQIAWRMEVAAEHARVDQSYRAPAL